MILLFKITILRIVAPVFQKSTQPCLNLKLQKRTVRIETPRKQNYVLIYLNVRMKAVIGVNGILGVLALVTAAELKLGRDYADAMMLNQIMLNPIMLNPSLIDVETLMTFKKLKNISRNVTLTRNVGMMNIMMNIQSSIQKYRVRLGT